MVIWRLLDGKTGHEKQTLGLSDAIAEITKVKLVNIQVSCARPGWKNWILGRFPEGRNLPNPDLLLAAGHATHPHILAAKRTTRAKAVVCMKPTLPYRCFDLCFVPEHDSPSKHSNVIATQGSLNAVKASKNKDKNTGLFLIGGTSKHYQWNSLSVIEQIRIIMNDQPAISWTLTTSRRTPDEFMEKIQNSNLSVQIVTSDTTGPEWIEKKLSATQFVWATPDSASMIYESLTAGCATGVLALDPVKKTRITSGINKLVSDGLISTDLARLPPKSSDSFNEANRCAQIILERFFPKLLAKP